MSVYSLLAIDVGTTNWKAALFDEQGHNIAQKSTKAVVEDDGNGASYNAEEMWGSIANIIKAVLTSTNIQPDAVCVTSMAEAGFPLGRNYEVVHNAITWYDPRSFKQAEMIAEVVGKDNLFRITGLEANPVFTLSKIMWLKENKKQVFDSIHKWLSIADFINFRLCKAVVTDYSLACRTQCFDIRQKKWSKDMLDHFNISTTIFPDVRSAGSIIGHVTATAAHDTGLKQGTPIVLGGHDHHCAFLAGGALLQEGAIFDSSGTVESIMTILPEHKEIPDSYMNMRIGNFIDPTRYVTMGGVLASGGSVEWALQNISLHAKGASFDYDEIINSIKNIDPGSNGLMFLPHLTGAGAPLWDPRSRGAFIGLRVEHTREHLIHAVFEGLCFELFILLEAVEKCFDVSPHTLQTVGGGAKNLHWQQLKADITAKTVNIPDIQDATAQGAALVGGVGIGLFDNFLEGSQAMYRLRHTIDPDPEKHHTYQKLYKIYTELYKRISNINHELYNIGT